MRTIKPTAAQLAEIRSAQTDSIVREFESHDKFQELLGRQTIDQALIEGLNELNNKVTDKIVSDIRRHRKIRRLSVPMAVYFNGKGN